MLTLLTGVSEMISSMKIFGQVFYILNKQRTFYCAGSELTFDTFPFLLYSDFPSFTHCPFSQDHKL